MTAAEQFQMSAELALAHSKIGDALEGLARYTDLATVHHLDGRTKIFLAQFHLREAALLITKQNTGTPDAPTPTLESHIALAREMVGTVAPRGPSENVGCNDPLPPSAEDARAASALECGVKSPLSLSLSPAAAANIGSTDAPPVTGENEKPAAGVTIPTL
jgi:hypothetical protein